MTRPLSDRNLEIAAHLRRLASEVAGRAYVPYSGDHTGAVLLLSDGMWVPGVRVENASYSLVIPAVINALTTAVACGRTDLVAAALSRTFRLEERAFLNELPTVTPEMFGPDVMSLNGGGLLPDVEREMFLFLSEPVPETDGDGLELAREMAQRAWVTESGFYVGCVLVTTDDQLVPGCNVENPDWTRILCAERNAIGTAASCGIRSFKKMYLTAPQDESVSPCGACRQVLVELAPNLEIVIDRGDAPPAIYTSSDLLPGSFSGRALRKR